MISINKKTEISSIGCLLRSTSKMYLVNTTYQNFGLPKMTEKNWEVRYNFHLK